VAPPANPGALVNTPSRGRGNLLDAAAGVQAGLDSPALPPPERRVGMRYRVEDVMTEDVVCAQQGTAYKELVKLLASRRVSAVPVVDEHRHVLGVVSEADLLRKQEQPGRPAARRLAGLRRRKDWAKARATVAAELMTRPAVTIDRQASLAEAARRMHREDVKRLPVVDAAGRLVGIVSRLDLLKTFLRSDEDLHREIVEDVIFGDLFMAPNRFDVHVQDGVVVLQGCCERRSLIPVVVRAVAAVEGVVRVENRLGYEVDDLSSPLPESLARPML
jgi:CBS-domain-containing membrane protein